jgi:hypothetical protein
MIELVVIEEKDVLKRNIFFTDGRGAYFSCSCCYAGQPRSRAVGDELAGMVAQIDLHKAALGRGIEAMRGQVKGQVLCAHAGVIEAGYGGLQIREGIARCADCGQSQHDCDREQT